MSNNNLASKIRNIELAKQKLEIKQDLYLQKALSSNNPSDIIAASSHIQTIQQREKSDKKSYVIDPLDFSTYAGYKDKPFSLSYGTLRRMAKTPIINSIIKTRKNQVAAFAEPQSDKYSTGFVVRKKRKLGEPLNQEVSNEEWGKIRYITDFLLNCGTNESWTADDFDTFLRKLVDDSLTFDQCTFEVIRDRRGRPYEFLATDASTYRIADSLDDDNYHGQRTSIKGYFPSYVQIYQGQAVSQFYPWELCFGTRNPSTNIMLNGYGTSELEELIQIVTSMLYSDEYNRKFFTQGAIPKGFLKVKGNVSEGTLQQFRQHWMSMIQGVQNSWRTPVVEADVEWVDLQKNNTDMEFGKWQEYLIKLSCGIYTIDPSEINFDLSGSSNGQKAMFEGNNEARLKHSKDKGLYPLLKFLQRKINRMIVSQIDPEYEFCFVGMDGMTIQEEAELATKKMTFMKLNEVRKDFNPNLEDLGEQGEMITNPIWAQMQQMANQNDMMQQQQQFQSENDVVAEEAPDKNNAEKGENPIEDAFNKFLQEL
jgi:hypothetical protein